MINSTFHTFDFGGAELSFLIERTTRRKTVAISVGYDGVRVLAPFDLNDDQITAIVRKKASWILRKEAGYSELGSTPPPREFFSGETFYYLGRAYRLKVVPDGNVVLTQNRRSRVRPDCPSANRRGGLGSPHSREERSPPLVSRTSKTAFSGSGSDVR